MNRDDIARLAEENGIVIVGEAMFRFAALVAAAERETLLKDGWRQCAVGQRTTQFCSMTEAAVKAEREACARVAALWDDDVDTRLKPSEAIRARGNP